MRFDSIPVVGLGFKAPAGQDFDNGVGSKLALLATNDFVHITLPGGKTICVAGDGTVDIDGIPQILTPIDSY